MHPHDFVRKSCRLPARIAFFVDREHNRGHNRERLQGTIQATNRGTQGRKLRRPAYFPSAEPIPRYVWP